MKIKTKIILTLASCLIPVGSIIHFGLVERSLPGDITLADISMMAQADGENSPGDWEAFYHPCQFEINIGVPPLVIIKTIDGTTRECVTGEGVCLYNSPICCVRLYGVCVL